MTSTVEGTDNTSLHSLKSSNERERDTIGFRIQFIQELLKDKELEPLVNFDICDTENFKGQLIEDSEYCDGKT